MLAFVLRRLLQSTAVMAVVAFIAFGCSTTSAIRSPGMLGQDATVETARACAASSGSTSRSTCSSAASSATRSGATSACRWRQGRKVSTLLKERLPATIELSMAAALIALFVGIPAGVYTALRRHSVLSTCCSPCR